MTPETQRIPISVRCMNLKLHSKAVFQNVGLLTNLFARATGAAANAKNEKRFIRVFQSKPFRIGTRPDVDYELIYTSETFDDVTDVCPALLAYIPTYKDLDTQLRLSIFYNSSITGGKDVILGLTNFTVSEMLRSCSYNSIGTMAIDIHSEYCTGIKAFIEIIDPLPALTDEIKLPVIASKSEKNPLTQNYVFFSDQDASSPLLKVSEQSWEPKFSGMVSLLFIENYLAAMRKSVVAWKLRQEQERIRQGKFISDSEALSYGWHVVEITVRGARLSVHDTSNVPVAPATSPQTSVPSNPPAANYSIRLPLSPEFVSDLDRVAPNAALVPASPQLERRTRTSSAAKGSFVSGRGGGLTRSKSGRLTSSSIVPSKGSQLPNKKYDELLPCTYVQVLMEDRGKTFSEPVGRTNTEYYTLYPVYGTNINAGFARKNAQQNATASQDKVQATCYEKEVIYNVFESTNRLFQPRRWLQWTQALQPQQATLTSRQNSHGEDGEGVTSALSRISDCSTISNADDSQTYTFDSQTATHTIFKMYVANSDRTSIRFDLMVETPNGQIKRMGTSVIPLSQSNNFTGWLPMTLFHTEDTAVNTGNNTPANSSSVATSNAAGSSVTGNCSNSYEFGEVLVDVKLYSPPVASSPTPLDVMDEVLHLQRRTDGTVDSLTNEMRCDYRYNLLQCYEWMWALGWTTQDPLMVDGGGSIASHLSQKDLQQIVDKMTSFVLDDRSSSPTPLVQSPTSPTPPPPTNNSNQNSPKPRRPSVTFHNSLDDSVLSPSTTSTVAPLNSAEDHVYGGNNTESVSVVTKIERSLSAGDLQDMVEHTLDPKRPTRRGSKILPTLKMDDDTDDEDDDDDDKGSDNEELGEIDNDLSAELNNPTKFQKRLLKKLSSKQLDINDVSVSVASLMLENSNSGNDKAAAGINQPNTDVSENHAMLLESIMRMDENQMDDVIEDSVSQSNKSTANDADPANSQMTSNDQTAVKHTESKPKRRGSTTSITAKSRIDVTYNLQWISDHIKEMQSMIDEIELLLAGLRHKIRADRCFRASVYKKDAEWQMLPTNFHYQLLGIQCHRPKRRGCPIEPDETIPMDVVHSVTCGAMTPHMLKHKKGGLFHQEQECEVKRNEVNILKGRYLTQVTEATHHQQHHAHTTTLLPMDAKEGPYKTLLMLGNKVQSWETQILEVGRRRMYAMSQSISIAVNSFLLKLNLLCKGAIEVSLAEKWLTAGFLVMFEGLLSVTGHEKSMLEDTITAVDILRNYRIRLLSKKAYEGSNVSQTRQSSRYVNVAASLAAASAAARSRTTSQHSDVGEDDDEKDLLPDPDFTFQGREIRIYLSHKAIQKLPESYRRLIVNDGDGAVIALFPILFTQGIDMQQTMANTFGSDMAAFELQYLVNNRALQRVNTYCHRVQPLDSTSMHHSKSVDLQQSIQASHMPPSVENHMMTKSGKVNYHPLASEIHQAINASAVQLSLKNVDLLEAVERLTVMLDGIRITFCKSGKDRTGMAVTLDQARQVSTRYGLFTGLLQHHALANLPTHSSSSHNNHHHHSTSGSNNNSNNANNNGTLTLMDQKLGDMANLMRVYGTRVMVAEKNIGRPVYSINLLQARFLPPLLRPPPSVCEALLKKDNS